MKIINLMKIAWQALMRNKTRAMLTMLGIIIGIASVIAGEPWAEFDKRHLLRDILSGFKHGDGDACKRNTGWYKYWFGKCADT